MRYFPRKNTPAKIHLPCTDPSTPHRAQLDISGIPKGISAITQAIFPLAMTTITHQYHSYKSKTYNETLFHSPTVSSTYPLHVSPLLFQSHDTGIAHRFPIESAPPLWGLPHEKRRKKTITLLPEKRTKEEQT